MLFFSGLVILPSNEPLMLPSYAWHSVASTLQNQRHGNASNGNGMEALRTRWSRNGPMEAWSSSIISRSLVHHARSSASRSLASRCRTSARDAKRKRATSTWQPCGRASLNMWMDEILHHLRNHGKPLFVGILPGESPFHSFFPFRWCDTDFLHPQYGKMSKWLVCNLWLP